MFSELNELVAHLIVRNFVNIPKDSPNHDYILEHIKGFLDLGKFQYEVTPNEIGTLIIKEAKN
jgi:hypothetical protein